MKKPTIEKQYADVELEAPIKIKIGDTTYSVKSPTLSVLIKISGIVSAYPQSEVAAEKTPEAVLSWVLTQGSKYEDVGDILATLILGWQKYPTDEFLGKFAQLSGEIEDTMLPSEYDEMLHMLLNNSETARFFQFTIFLSELNLLEGKRERKTDQYQA